MTKKFFFGCWGLLFGLIWQSVLSAQQIQNDVEIRNEVLYVDTDWTHDLVMFSIDPSYPNHLTIHIAQFEELARMGIAMTVEGALEYADESDIVRKRLDQFDRVEVRVLEGDDVVIVHPNVAVPFMILGGPGSDRLGGGSGDDTILGHDQGVSLNPTDAGNDTLFGEAGNDLLFGGPLDDFIDGGADNDHIFGGQGDDQLFGRSGKDYLFGENGDDYIDGEMDGDEDVLIGGNGRDYFVAMRVVMMSEEVTKTIRNKEVTRKRKWTETLEEDIIADFDWESGDQAPAVNVE
ncbi:calcium-binding protein [Rubripirellula reticaptiva]|uniref:RTX-I toxin determinant A from serotypes 1/9 n=1 Tax=Rubripirellula reticaptiva TaxID=2528013 RepID=A0A5C6E9P9_9BACT|nr:calcium-binding protein [Rubripirellula reticaptiva]TWU46423.1 RTX-I toxin determinant A from serotypes 1/9 [Rubripirellula reticaptiva]